MRPVCSKAPPTAEAWAERLASACDGIAALTADARFRRAAGILRGKRIGRRAADDGEALEMARAFLKAGLARSKSAAIRRAAVLMAAPNTIEATARRLAKKFNAEKLTVVDRREG